MAEKSSKIVKKGDQWSQDKIVATFNHLRKEQRAIANKLAEVDAEKNEHATVMKALKKVDPDRKCFRMVGGVLVERTVKDVVPALQYNLEQLTVLLEKLTVQLTEKGKELNSFKQKHGIKIHEEKEQEDKTASTTNSKSEPSQGVLISP